MQCRLGLRKNEAPICGPVLDARVQRVRRAHGEKRARVHLEPQARWLIVQEGERTERNVRVGRDRGRVSLDRSVRLQINFRLP